MSVMLLFPGGAPESLEELRRLRRQGISVVGASSIINDPSIRFYDDWEFLPFVADDAFEDAVTALIARKSITSIFTRHPVIGRYLKTVIAKRQLAVALDTVPFADATMRYHASIFAQRDVMHAIPFALDMAHEKPPLNRLQQAALLAHALRVDGQSSDEKIMALMEIFRSCPEGDILEIGSFWGRSASVLAMLANYNNIGALLCIDPWQNAAAHQEGVGEHVNAEAGALDFNSAFQGFQINLMPYYGRVNYLRGQSHEWRAHYKPNVSVTSEAFGTIIYTGHIACLHIDGNHDLSHIKQDIADWLPLVMPGGWIIIDDYQWTFGDGPQIAADAWLEKNSVQVVCSFVIGSALFIKLRD